MTLTKLAGGMAAVGVLHWIWTLPPWPLASRADSTPTVGLVAESDLPQRS